MSTHLRTFAPGIPISTSVHTCCHATSVHTHPRTAHSPTTSRTRMFTLPHIHTPVFPRFRDPAITVARILSVIHIHVSTLPGAINHRKHAGLTYNTSYIVLAPNIRRPPPRLSCSLSPLPPLSPPPDPPHPPTVVCCSFPSLFVFRSSGRSWQHTSSSGEPTRRETRWLARARRMRVR